MTDRPTFYFGRGSGDCIAARMEPGHRFSVFVGSGKTGEQGKTFTDYRWELSRLADFFRAMWEIYGREIYINHNNIDDPHDEVLIHSFDLREISQ